MGYIKEPYGVDFVVENKPVSLEDRKFINDIINHYKTTGRIKKINKPKVEKGKKTKLKNNTKQPVV